MKARIQLALMGCLVSIAAHLYLTLHYFQLKFGLAAASSVCNLNSTFNCDAVAASNYASLFEVPVSIWGAALNVVLFVLILWSWLEWSTAPERLKRWTLLLCGLSLTGSIVMGAISLLALGSYCLVCMGLYVLSLLIFLAFKGAVKEPFWRGLSADLPALVGESRGIAIAFAAIPLIAFFTYRAFVTNLGDPQIDAMVASTLSEWEQAEKQNFVAKPSLVMGPAQEAAVLTLAEFADFRCSHCKHASYSLDAFVRSHPDVRFEFYSFPLDGACNEKIEASNGISCRLAAAVLCAAKDGKGWELHHQLYEIQDQVNQQNSVADVDPLLAQSVVQVGLNWEHLKTCITDPSTEDAIRAQAKQGALVNVAGTPTIFANGRLLNGGQLVPVLQGARVQALENRKN